ncbi:hypothetical protein AAFF_G00381440 [Aldrovandia affinis]|uniref:Uncharacterized protein n=1 Tax=Aldrovandia affinis TaxID=143900 RepID=A0AAD7T8Y0_9TELE|nr:hypothetical protein AAFF_G00381440 [Aldrovandia affinis]
MAYSCRWPFSSAILKEPPVLCVSRLSLRFSIPQDAPASRATSPASDSVAAGRSSARSLRTGLCPSLQSTVMGVGDPRLNWRVFSISRERGDFARPEHVTEAGAAEIRVPPPSAAGTFRLEPAGRILMETPVLIIPTVVLELRVSCLGAEPGQDHSPPALTPPQR